MLSSTPGWRVRKRATAGGTIEAAAEGERPQFGLDVVESAEDRIGTLEQQVSGVGQHRPLRHASDEHRAELGLKRGDLPRDGRLGIAERFRRGRERPVAGHLAKHPESSRIQHAFKLYPLNQTPICIYDRVRAQSSSTP
jgi:hypothetical protein